MNFVFTNGVFELRWLKPFDDKAELMESTTPERALQVGKAAEHIVCADLILAGRLAFLADQGARYDVVVDEDGFLIRVQVKTSAKPKKHPQCPGSGPTYMFYTRRAGKGARRLVGNNEFDVLALVALDIRKVAYIPISNRVLQTIHLRVPN